VAPRSIWNGAIAFGAVTVPIKVFGAVEDKSIRFKEVHLKDGAPIAHKLVDPTTKGSKEIDRKHVVKGYEVADGEWVEMTDDEIKAADQPERKAIELAVFVPRADIDPVYYDKPYNLAPQDGAEPGYALLAEGLKRTERVGIGRVVLRTKEQLVALRADEGGLIRMLTLHASDEVLDKKDLDVPRAGKKPAPKEVKMAETLVDQLGADFQPSRYKDTYRDRVLKLVEAKAKGKEPDLEMPEPPEPTDDLLAALEASLKGAKKR
jgi:DNA end-binding protein Ku